MIELSSNRPERTAPGSVLLGPAGPLEVVSSGRLPSSGGRERRLVEFRQVGDRESAEALRGAVLRGAPLEDHDALWVHELIGCSVVERGGRPLGNVVEVEANPASDLLVLDRGLLIPLRFVVDSQPGVLTVEVPEGLVDL